MVSEEDITLGPKTVSVTQSFVYILLKVKVTENASDTDIEGGRSVPTSLNLSGAIYTSQLASENRQKAPQGCEHFARTLSYNIHPKLKKRNVLEPEILLPTMPTCLRQKNVKKKVSLLLKGALGLDSLSTCWDRLKSENSNIVMVVSKAFV